MAEKMHYYNQQLAREIKKIYGNAYGELQPIVIDVLLRRKYAFNLSKEECLIAARRMKNNCERIEFKEMGFFNGQYSILERKIEMGNEIMNKTMSNDDLLNLYNYIVHEIFHSLSSYIREYHENDIWCIDFTKENINWLNSINNSDDQDLKETHSISSGLLERDTYFNIFSTYGLAWEEANNEAASSLIVFDRKDAYISDIETAYSDIARLLPHIFSAAIGTSDKRLISKGIKGNDFYDEEISQHFIDGNFDCIIEDIQKLDFAIETMNNTLYDQDQQSNSKQLIKKILKESIRNIEEASLSILDKQIKNDPRDVSEEMLSEIITRFNKIDLVCNYICNFNGIENPSDNEKSVHFYEDEIFRKIESIYIVSKHKEKFADKFDLASSFIAKEGKAFEQADFLKEKYNIDVNEEANFLWDNLDNITSSLPNPYFDMLKREDQNDGKIWDNEEIISKLKGIVETVISKKEEELQKAPMRSIDFLSQVLGVKLDENDNLNNSFILNSKYSTDISPSKLDSLSQLDLEIKNNVLKMAQVSYGQTKDFVSHEITELSTKIASLYLDKMNSQLNVVKNIVDSSQEYYLCKNVKNEKNETIFETFSTLQKAKNEYFVTVKDYKQKGSIEDDKLDEKKHKVDENYSKIENRLLYYYIKNELGNSVLQGDLPELENSIENGNFEETFELFRKQYGIKRSLSYYKSKFRAQIKIFQVKQKSKEIISKIRSNKQDTLPSSTQDNSLNSNLDTGENKSSTQFRNGLVENTYDPGEVVIQEESDVVSQPSKKSIDDGNFQL